MHILFGGIFNGKTDYCLEHYAPDAFITSDIQSVTLHGQTVAIANFGQLVQDYLQLDEIEASEQVLTHIKRITATNTVICICDDVSRGVVPLDQQERKMRDVLGRLYQQLFKEADSVTRIWYGLAETIK